VKNITILSGLFKKLNFVWMMNMEVSWKLWYFTFGAKEFK